MTTLEPVAWMYHHSDLGEFEFIKTETLRNRCRAMGAFPESSGWTETPLVPLATAQALEARVRELEEALRGIEKVPQHAVHYARAALKGSSYERR